MQVRYWALDSWDNEYATLKVDGREWWSQLYQVSSSATDNKCMRSGGRLYTGSFPNPHGDDTDAHKCYWDLDFTMAHDSASVKIELSSSVDQSADDEAFAFNNLELFLDAEPYAAKQIEDLPGKDPWSDEIVTSLGSDLGMMHGPWGSETASVQRTFGVQQHQLIKISARFWAIRSWDSETAYMTVDGVEWWSAQRTQSNSCDNGWMEETSNIPGIAELGSPVCYYDIEVEDVHSATEFVVRFHTDIDSDKTDASWGFSHVAVYTDGEKLPPFLEAVYDHSGEGWDNQLYTDLASEGPPTAGMASSRATCALSKFVHNFTHSSTHAT